MRYNEIRCCRLKVLNWSDLDQMQVILNIHNPIYSTDPSYKQFEQFRVSVEEFTYQYASVVYAVYLLCWRCCG